MSCHACCKSMLQIKIKQFYYILHLLQENIFCNTFRQLLLEYKNNIFNNYNINDNQRCLHGNKYPQKKT